MSLKIVKLVESPVHLNFTGGITPTGAYIAETTYNTGESVSYLGSSYVAIQETTGNLPTNTTYWQLLSLKGDGGTSGGTTGQVLVKASNTDFDNEWKTLDPDDLDDTSTTNKFVTTAEKGVWNGKQDALGFTPENVASKKITLTDSDSDYPTTRAVNTALGSKITWGGDNTASKGLIGTTSNQPLGFIVDNSEKMTILANGNVGIGKTNPAANLEVYSSLAPAPTIFRINNRNIHYLEFGGAYPTGMLVGGYENHIRSSNADNFIIYTSNSVPLHLGTNSTSRLTITGAGNVGIGTTNPLARLHVSAGAGNDTIMRLENNAANNAYLYFNTNADWSVGSRVDNSNAFTFANASSLASNNRMVITTGGNVGIGTTAPAAQFDINYSGTTPLNINRNGVPVSDGYFRIINYTSSAGVFSPIFNGKSNNDGFPGFALMGDATSDTGNKALVSIIARVNNGLVSNRPLFSVANFDPFTDANVKLLINAAGNVGIGITTPTAKLDINSDILRLRTAKTPATAGASGNAGDICWDSSYFYICVATNSWKRAALTSW